MGRDGDGDGVDFPKATKNQKNENLLGRRKNCLHLIESYVISYLGGPFWHFKEQKRGTVVDQSQRHALESYQKEASPIEV